jgi:hypothetical protein
MHRRSAEIGTSSAICFHPAMHGYGPTRTGRVCRVCSSWRSDRRLAIKNNNTGGGSVVYVRTSKIPMAEEMREAARVIRTHVLVRITGGTTQRVCVCVIVPRCHLVCSWPGAASATTKKRVPNVSLQIKKKDISDYLGLSLKQPHSNHTAR